MMMIMMMMAMVWYAQGAGRSSAHASTKVKMLTPFSLRSRHGDVSSLSSLMSSGQQRHWDELDAVQGTTTAAVAARRRSGSERYVTPVTATVVQAHRASDAGSTTTHALTTEPSPSSDHVPATVRMRSVSDSVTSIKKSKKLVG